MTEAKPLYAKILDGALMAFYVGLLGGLLWAVLGMAWILVGIGVKL